MAAKGKGVRPLMPKSAFKPGRTPDRVARRAAGQAGASGLKGQKQGGKKK